ncbi:RHS repeat domain-containing protein, partial [Dokdonia pacifica]
NGTTVATHTMTQNFPSLVGDMVMYDEGTQISSLNLYATNINKSLQKVDYQYNIRGWLTDINNNNSKEGDLFHFHINYDSKQGMSATGSITPLYNGNISQTMWKTANTDNQIRAYGYAYDDLNRINSGFSRRGTNFDTVDSYSLINVSYDKNGNIGGLERRGLGSGTEVIDDLTYTYDGNQLLSVTDLSANTSSSISNQGFYDGNTSGDDFEYDVNGNMIKDRNKGITDNIEYNHLNLPEIVKINTTDSQGNTQQGTITYIYDATGIKLAKIVDDQSQNSTITTYYAGGYIYENNNNNVESLKMFPHPEGYVEPVYSTSKSIQKFNTLTQATSFSSYQYAFNYTDHLGNVRLTYADSDGDGAITPSSEIISEKHYYPFGLQQKGYNDVVTSNSNSMAERFAFNGKENNPELGLEWYDFGARNYDASLGRWMNIDPMADLYVDMSPYHNVANNPIIFIDPEGESYYYAQDGTFLFETDDDKDDVYAWQEGEGKKRTHNPDGSYQDEWVEGSFGQLKHDGEAVSHDVFLGFAAAVAEESSGDKNESFAIASTTLNFLAEGGSTQLQTLEDLVLYDNNFIQGATQKGYSEYLKSKNKNSENEIGAVINALSGGTDYSGGANGWDGIDLISTKHSNSHRGYRWSSDSKSLVEKYRKDNNGGVKVGKWTYTSKNPQIQVQRIVKKTIFTKLLTGRGERKQSETKFKK